MRGRSTGFISQIGEGGRFRRASKLDRNNANSIPGLSSCQYDPNCMALALIGRCGGCWSSIFPWCKFTRILSPTLNSRFGSLAGTRGMYHNGDALHGCAGLAFE